MELPIVVQSATDLECGDLSPLLLGVGEGIKKSGDDSPQSNCGNKIVLLLSKPDSFLDPNGTGSRRS
jgi:hypothetical protein